MNTEYIKYSVRNNVKNEHLAHLIDFIERDIGWDSLCLIEDEKTYDLITGETTKLVTRNGREIHDASIYEIIIGPENVTMQDKHGGMIMLIPRKLFFATFNTLLPYYK